MARPAHGDSVWIGARPTPGATGLLVALVASYLVLLYLDDNQAKWVVDHLGLLPRQAIGPRPWQLVTGALIHPDLGSFVRDLFGVWVFATAAEQVLGRTRMLTIFGVAQVAGALAVAGVGRLVSPNVVVPGCLPAWFALVMVFGLSYGAMPLRLFGLAELKASTLAWLTLGLSAGVSLFGGDWPVLAGDLVGVATGWVMLRGGVISRLDLAWQRWKLKRMRRRYRVISGGRDSRRYLN